MNFQSRWRYVRSKADPATVVIFAVIAAIIVFAIVDAIRKHWITGSTGVFLVCFVPAVICHEVSHGVVALWRGDDTAKQAGRLTLNPLKHVDPFGSIVVPIIFAITSGTPFGWAKPVPVSVARLRHPRNDAVLVGLAGPATNIILATIAGLGIHLLYVHGAFFTNVGTPTGAGTWLGEFGVVNIILAVFNLIPIPPLDGSALLERLIPDRYIGQYYQMRFFFIIIVVLIMISDRGAVTNLLQHVEIWYYNRFL
jgi:Zn-dependent protease